MPMDVKLLKKNGGKTQKLQCYFQIVFTYIDKGANWKKSMS